MRLTGDLPFLETYAWLQYNEGNPLPKPKEVEAPLALDDMELVPYDQQPLLDNVDQSIKLKLGMGMGNGGHQ